MEQDEPNALVVQPFGEHVCSALKNSVPRSFAGLSKMSDSIMSRGRSKCLYWLHKQACFLLTC